MSFLVLLLVLLFGALAGAAAVWPFARARGGPRAPAEAWMADPSLGEGHRPPDLGALGSQLLGLVRQALQAGGVALLKPCSEGWQVVLTSPGIPFAGRAPVPSKEGLVGLAGQGDRPILADGVHAQALGYLASPQGKVSVALVPVHHRSEVRGILACHREAGRPFDEPEVALLKRSTTLLAGWEALVAHTVRMESARLQEERVAAGTQHLLRVESPDELCGLLLEALFDILPAHYGFVVLASTVHQYYYLETKKFPAPDGFALRPGSWTHWVMNHPGGTLYLDGTASRETAMPILFQEERFPADRVVLLHPMGTEGERFGAVGIVGRASNPFSARDREHASALLGPAGALMDLALLHLSHKNMAIRDPLTGLFNRRHMDEVLSMELKRSQRQGTSCAVILTDLDHFKAVNDSHGHSAGDAALRIAAQRVRESVREIDIACRYGGEEFAVILPDCQAAEAYRVAERIRQCVGDTPFPVSGELSLPVTISLGVSAFPSPSNTFAGLLKAADASLYEAKRRGRNLTVQAGGR